MPLQLVSVRPPRLHAQNLSLSSGNLCKAEVLTEAYESGEVAPEKCEDPENFADPQTKYLTFKTWARHLHYTHNFKGDAPPRAEKKKNTAAVLASVERSTGWVHG